MSSDYESMKVAQLRSLCKSRGIECDGRKDELISLLKQRDEEAAVAASQEPNSGENLAPLVEPSLSSEDLKVLATIADEMKHLRRQWLSQLPHHGQSQFVHQGYAGSTSRK